MRRPASSLLLATLTLAAVLFPGTAVFARPAVSACLNLDPAQLAIGLEEAEVIVIATVQGYEAEKSVSLLPEAYLKGPALGGEVTLPFPDPRPKCPLAQFEPGMRVLAVFDEGSQGLTWPGSGEVWVLKDGRATNQGPAPDERTEASLVQTIRSITGQYAVPAESEDEGATIDWTGTVLPIGGLLVVVFAIGLVLMRTWHRIDPS